MVGAPLSPASRGDGGGRGQGGQRMGGMHHQRKGRRYPNERRQSWGKAKRRRVEADGPTVQALKGTISSADTERDNVKAD